MRNPVLSYLKRSLPADGEVAVVHSDLSNFTQGGEYFKRLLLVALKELVNDGWTLLFPAFTFSFCSGDDFHFQDSRSETGILSDLILKNFVTSRRTEHPIYSFAVLGPRTNDILSCVPETTFGKGSIFEFLESYNTTIIMFGCGFHYCTQMHRYEEINQVPYRTYKTFNGDANFGRGIQNVSVKMFVRDRVIDAENDWTVAIDLFKQAKSYREDFLLGGKISLINLSDLVEICNAELRKDEFVFIENKLKVQKTIRDIQEKSINDSISISIFGHANHDIITKHFWGQLQDVVPERDFKIKNPPFAQVYRQLLDEKSEFNVNPPKIKIFIDKLEDIPGFKWSSLEESISAIKDYSEIIKNYHNKSGGWLILNLFNSIGSELSDLTAFQINSVCAQCNNVLKESFKDISQVMWVDVGAAMMHYPGDIIDSRLRYLGKFPYSEGFSAELSMIWISYIVAILGKAARLLVVDLDNTLWGGVLGEDGISGLKLGGDYPGNAFQEFQTAILSHLHRGVAIAIASKNDEKLALEAIEMHEEMLIKLEHIQNHKINWSEKWKNIYEIARELNLGLSSVLFIDDNPVEREKIKLNLPDVKVLPLGEDPSKYVEILNSSPFLRPTETTSEDLTRLKSFTSEKFRKELQQNSVSIEDFYRSLEIKLSLSRLNESNATRAAQLCVKTNQFNTTSRRYEQAELFRMQANGDDVFVINYEDKFSPAENIGLIIIKYDNVSSATIDLYLLSCRVLGRGIENIIPKLAVNLASERNCEILTAEIIETPRNTPVRQIFDISGFAQKAQNVWYSLAEPVDIEDWVNVNINKDLNHGN